MPRLATQTQELADTEPDVLIFEGPAVLSDTAERVAMLLGGSPTLMQLRSDTLRELSEAATLKRFRGSRAAFYLNHGLYFVTKGTLKCHVGRLSFSLTPTDFAGTHNILEVLAGITPAFTCTQDVELLHIPTTKARSFVTQSPAFKRILEQGPLFTHLMDAAWLLEPSQATH